MGSKTWCTSNWDRYCGYSLIQLCLNFRGQCFWMESVRLNIKTVIFEFERHTWPSGSPSSLTAVNTHKVTLHLVWKIIDCIISREPHAYLVCAISPSVAAFLCLCPVVSRSRGLEHHLYLHPCSARERRGLQPCPAEELPHPGPVSPGTTSTHLLHLPTDCSQVSLYLQPARPLQHIPGDTLIENTQEGFIYTDIVSEERPQVHLFKMKCQKFDRKSCAFSNHLLFRYKWGVRHFASILSVFTALLPTWKEPGFCH